MFQVMRPCFFPRMFGLVRVVGDMPGRGGMIASRGGVWYRAMRVMRRGSGMLGVARCGRGWIPRGRCACGRTSGRGRATARHTAMSAAGRMRGIVGVATGTTAAGHVASRMTHHGSELCQVHHAIPIRVKPSEHRMHFVWSEREAQLCKHATQIRFLDACLSRSTGLRQCPKQVGNGLVIHTMNRCCR
jgi:hypothetical protein